MKTFENFELTNKQKDYLKKANARKEIRKYIAENGVEPDATTIESYHTYTPKQYERSKE